MQACWAQRYLEQVNHNSKENKMSATNNGRSVMVQGRIVWVSGDLFKGRPKTDMQTKQVKIDPKTGQPMMEFGFGLAVPKSVLNQMGEGQPGQIWAAMHEEAFTLFPSRQIPPGFAMKYKDGDGIDDKGVPFAQREGYAGHIVLACTTSIPIKFYKWENGQNILINEGIKCGDYVNVQVNVKAHPAVGTAKAGLYMNPLAVQFLGFGKEIINAPSGDQIFGTQAPPMPQGASATPIAPQGMIVPTGAPVMGQPLGGYQQPAPSTPVQPHWGVLPQSHQPAAQPAAMPSFPAQNTYGQPTPAAQPAGFPMPGVR